MSEHAPVTREVTASMLAIGDELLSGRIKDRNITHLAQVLAQAGIDLKEVRIVADDPGVIVEALDGLRHRYDYVFTSGGIGPTHDDVTADAVAMAFGLPCDYDDLAIRLLEKMYRDRGVPFTQARKRMARMPRGAAHIANPMSAAPGFVVGNVHVMAGVPEVFQAMLDNVLPTLRTGPMALARSVHSPFAEGDIAGPLGLIQKEHPYTAIGSYPIGTSSTDIVVRARDAAALDAAALAVECMIQTMGSVTTGGNEEEPACGEDDARQLQGNPARRTD
ncbi:competence/damage-inducible protein A [Rhodanobacter denitrificans]|uniref:competence/damage-inducible protein A n=1 Tax=Rhodanobacter denitrificans TaxID=666685 RepID=UPI001F47B5E4|nr:competence/damage-inducible protein A [Rhodanobacter denitrificans]UJJ60240.1 competence/damage-inducible protein A [Rhodanobacter denitrificans]